MAIRRPAGPDAPPRSRYDGSRMPLDEYLALPEEKPYLEYWDGLVVQKGVTGPDHWQLVNMLTVEIGLFARRTGGRAGPEASVRFEGHGVLLPDCAYWTPGRFVRDGAAASPPTLAVEFRSPGQTLASQRTKCRRMRANGVDVCWLVDPDTRTVERFEGEADGMPFPADAALESPCLPGFSLPLSKLFAALDD